MEGKNAQISISSFEIPINDYEIDMHKDSSKEKKNEILDLLTNHNHLKSESEFEEIKESLHHLCQKGDLELIKILLSDTIQNDTKDLTFKIDKTNQTASLFKVNQSLTDLIVPKTVKYEMKDYLVTSISSLCCSFYGPTKIKSIKFEEDSSVSTIYGYAFSRSNIEELYFPESLIELKEGWCHGLKELRKIKISPSNKQFIFKDDKYLLGKSDSKSDEFDTILFVNRDAKEISIPPNIKFIGSNSFSYSKIEKISIPPNLIKICEYAFYDCPNLRNVIIPSNSNLQTIDERAFSCSGIKKIFIPPKVTKICEHAFSYCSDLVKVEFQANSNLQIIESCAFAFFLEIEEISIPPSLTKICDSAFSGCYYLREFVIPTNSNLQTIGKSAFSLSKINRIYFPESLIELKEGWCDGLTKLRKIIISPSNKQFILKDDKCLIGKSDSKSDEFDTILFVSRDAEEISIPPSLIKICENALSDCSDLKKVIIPTNSNLQTIEKDAFSLSNIEELYFPESLIELKEGWCHGLKELRKIIISPSNKQFIFKDDKYLLGKSDSKSDEFDTILFVSRDAKEISIPPNIKIFGSNSFTNSKIEKISIPSNLTKICEYTFSDCSNLRKVIIPSKSNLQIIESNAFSGSKIEEIYIPSGLTKICKNAFSFCSDLRKVVIPSNSNLQIIESDAFSGSKINGICIPPSLKKLGDNAFFGCNEFLIIEIPEETKLRSIPISAFGLCPKLIIMIPLSLFEKFFK